MLVSEHRVPIPAERSFRDERDVLYSFRHLMTKPLSKSFFVEGSFVIEFKNVHKTFEEGHLFTLRGVDCRFHQARFSELSARAAGSPPYAALTCWNDPIQARYGSMESSRTVSLRGVGCLVRESAWSFNTSTCLAGYGLPKHRLPLGLARYPKKDIMERVTVLAS